MRKSFSFRGKREVVERQYEEILGLKTMAEFRDHVDRTYPAYINWPILQAIDEMYLTRNERLKLDPRKGGELNSTSKVARLRPSDSLLDISVLVRLNHRFEMVIAGRRDIRVESIDLVYLLSEREFCERRGG